MGGRTNPKARIELRQEVKKLIVQKMQERFSSLHEHKYPTSQEVQGYFYSEGLVNVILYEIKLLLQDSELKPDFKRHFDMTDWNSFDGHWWLLGREGHKLLQTRDPWTDDDADKLTTTLKRLKAILKFFKHPGCCLNVIEKSGHNSLAI